MSDACIGCLLAVAIAKVTASTCVIGLLHMRTAELSNQCGSVTRCHSLKIALYGDNPPKTLGKMENNVFMRKQ